MWQTKVGKTDMNETKFEKRIQKFYGLDKQELANSSVSKIKSLKNINKSILKENKKFKVVRSIGNTLVKGGSCGAGIAGTVNTIFPNLVPVLASSLTTASNISTASKVAGLFAAASKPVAIISGPMVIGIGAACGAILYSGYRLVKSAIKGLVIMNDRKKAKTLCK